MTVCEETGRLVEYPHVCEVMLSCSHRMVKKCGESHDESSTLTTAE